MKSKSEILRIGIVIYFLVCLLMFILSIFDSRYSIVLNVLIFLYGILLIIFRTEAITILDEHKNSFKIKHPRIGHIYNPGVVALLITGAASSLFWISLIGILYAYVRNIWLIKFLHNYFGLNGYVLLGVADIPYALFSALLFALPFALISRRRLFLSPVIFMFSFWIGLFFSFLVFSPFFESYQEILTFLTSNIMIWVFIGFFILFAWFGARLRNHIANYSSKSSSAIAQ